MSKKEYNKSETEDTVNQEPETEVTPEQPAAEAGGAAAPRRDEI